MDKMGRSKNPQRGAALILVLIVVFLLSALAASMIYTTQTDILASANYRFLTQARFTAEAGAQAAVNWIAYSLTANSDSGINTNVYPVSDNSSPINPKEIILSSVAGAGLYPPDNSTVPGLFQTQIANLNSGSLNGLSLLPGSKVTVTAKLLSMYPLASISGTNVYMQNWEITSLGTVNAIPGKPAQVQVVERITHSALPVFGEGAFGTSAGCGSLNFGGSFSTDSYDSNLGAYGGTNVSNSGGNVGTNGNLTVGGSVSIGGDLYSPNTGVGDCSAGNVDALTVNGNSTVAVKLSSTVNYPTPKAPTTAPPLTDVINNTHNACIPTGCTSDGQNIVLAPGTSSTPASLGNLSVSGGNVTVTLSSGYYNFNSISFTSNATLILNLNAARDPVVINVAGAPSLATPISLAGSSITDPNGKPSDLSISYAGTGTIQLAGGSSMFAVVYAPNATIDMRGTSGFYGAVVGKTVSNSGNAAIHYDRSLATKYYMPGSWHVASFTWSKY